MWIQIILSKVFRTDFLYVFRHFGRISHIVTTQENARWIHIWANVLSIVMNWCKILFVLHLKYTQIVLRIMFMLLFLNSWYKTLRFSRTKLFHTEIPRKIFLLHDVDVFTISAQHVLYFYFGILLVDSKHFCRFR